MGKGAERHKHPLDERYKMTPKQKDAYQEAERRIAEAKANKAEKLDLRLGSDLIELPPEIADLTELKSLDLRDTQVADIAPLGTLTALQTLALNRTKVADIAPLGTLTALQTLDLGNTQVADIAPLGTLTALQTLDLSDTQVADIAPLGTLTALQILDLSNTQVADIAPLGTLTALQTLDLDSTKVVDIAPLGTLTALQRLTLNRTKVADIAPLSTLTALQRLYLSNTQVADIAPLGTLTALQELSLSNTQVADIAPLGTLTALQRLTLNSTKVADIAPLGTLTALQELYLSNTQVADIAPLGTLTALRRLALNSIQVADIAPLGTLTALQILTLSNTKVADIAPLGTLTALQSLDLDDTKVADITPLGTLTALRRLALNSTKVADIAPLGTLTALQELRLDSTKVADIAPLQHHPALRQFLARKSDITDFRPLLTWPALRTEAKKTGLFPSYLQIENSAATRADPELAKIVQENDGIERIHSILDYLATLPPWPEPLPWKPTEPEPGPHPKGPIKTAYRDDKLVIVSPDTELEGDSEARAKQGWAALMDYLSDFTDQRERIGNQMPALVKAFCALERALGDDYEAINPIQLGMQAERLIRLSKRAHDMLMEDDAEDVNAFTLELARYLPRFPVWQEYLKDAQDEDVIRVQKAMQDLRDLNASIEKDRSVDKDVPISYGEILDATEEQPEDQLMALGGERATIEILLTVAEKAKEEADEAKEKGFFSAYREEVRKTRIKALAKAQVGVEVAVAVSIGVATDLLLNNAEIIKRIAIHFPEQYQYVLHVLQYIGLF